MLTVNRFDVIIKDDQVVGLTYTDPSCWETIPGIDEQGYPTRIRYQRGPWLVPLYISTACGLLFLGILGLLYVRKLQHLAHQRQTLIEVKRTIKIPARR